MLPIPSFDYELSLLPPGTRFVLGIDEVGRGPWAGPVTVTAFLLDIESDLPALLQNLGVRDSKTLSSSQREKIFSVIEKQNCSFVVKSLMSSDIDKLGISTCINNLINDCIHYFYGSFDYVLLDGGLKPQVQLPYKTIIKGDARCISIAAASICAKVTRDIFMTKVHQDFPYYDFISNKGYGTKKHRQGLLEHGVCIHHRRSYKPIKEILGFTK